jgi:DNA-binding LytR/AlgR family response regulator
VDLIFLDVEMPDMSGLELVDSLAEPPSIVMVTGKEEYAVDAFEAAVTDYLVKPVRYSRFLQAVSRVEEEMQKETASEKEAAPANAPDVRVAEADGGDGGSADHVFLKVDRRLIRVNLTDIQWIEAQGDYMMVQAHSKRYLIHSTMKELDEKLPSDQFVRVHRSYIVRIDQIKDIEDTTLVIDGEVIPIGGSYYDTLIDRIQTL